MKSEESAAPERTFFELRFQSNVALVSTVRRFVGDFYADILGDQDAAQKLAMATHELLENAGGYSIDRHAEVCIAARDVNQQIEVTITTKNRASADRLQLVRQALDDVIAAEDPGAHYITLVRRAAKRRDGGSGLGLGRIRAEADLGLAYTIEDDTLTLKASGLFARPLTQSGIENPGGRKQENVEETG